MPQASSALSAQGDVTTGALPTSRLRRLPPPLSSVGFDRIFPHPPSYARVQRAEDTFRPGRSVAIKVMNLGCGAIGIREVRYLRFLGSLPKSEFSPGRTWCVTAEGAEESLPL